MWRACRGGDGESAEHPVGNTEMSRVPVETRVHPPQARHHLRSRHSSDTLALPSPPIPTIRAPAALSSCAVAHPPSGSFWRGELIAAHKVIRLDEDSEKRDEAGRRKGDVRDEEETSREGTRW